MSAPNTAPFIWSTPLAYTHASHENAPIEPHVRLAEYGAGLQFDVAAVPPGTTTEYNNAAFASEMVYVPHWSDDETRGLDPFRIILRDPAVEITENDWQSLDMFWRSSGIAPADFEPAPPNSGYIGAYTMGVGEHTYEEGEYSFTVSDQGLAVASLRVLFNRAGSWGGIIPVPLDSPLSRLTARAPLPPDDHLPRHSAE